MITQRGLLKELKLKERDELRAVLQERDAEIASIKPAQKQNECWCDAMGIGKPGVSCGDCPTRDYAGQEPLTDAEIEQFLKEKQP